MFTDIGGYFSDDAGTMTIESDVKLFRCYANVFFAAFGACN